MGALVLVDLLVVPVIALFSVVDFALPDVRDLDLLRHVVLDLALLAVVGLQLHDVHDLDLLRCVILDLAPLAVVGTVCKWDSLFQSISAILVCLC